MTSAWLIWGSLCVSGECPVTVCTDIKKYTRNVFIHKQVIGYATEYMWLRSDKPEDADAENTAKDLWTRDRKDATAR